MGRAEARIAVDPDSDGGRYPDGDGGKIDYTAADAGALIKYRHDNPGEVELEELFDAARASRLRRWPLDED